MRKNLSINRADKLEQIVVERNFRFEKIQTNEPITHVLFAFHGYGQLVTYFKRKFAALNLPNTLIVFPEGMHRFYLNGSSGRVGASWMTKEWRENDIQENNQALNTLFQHINAKYNPAKISVLGFSQGGATAARWVAASSFQCDHFIAWGSVFPPDLIDEKNELVATKKTAVFGNQDPYFPTTELEKIQTDYTKQNFKCVIFEGAHDIEATTLKTIFA